MPLPTTEVDATTPKYLRDKYAIVGVGETTYTRGSGKTTRALGTWAVRNAILDAGLKAADIDGMLSYSGGDSTSATFIAGDLGIRLNFYMDVVGGGSSTEALGRHRDRADRGRLLQDGGDLPLDERLFAGPHRRHRRALGGTGRRRHAAQPRLWLAERRAELRPDLYAPHVRLRHQARAGRRGQGGAQPPRLEQPEGLLQKALHDRRRAVEPLYLQAVASAGLLRRDRQRDLGRRDLGRARPRHEAALGADPRRRRPVLASRGSTCITSTGRSRPSPAITRARILWPNAGVGPEDIDVTGSYDAFTFTTMLQLEDYGFCKKGEGGDYVSSGAIQLGGRRPNNTSGGHLCEGYTHGMNMVIENTRQLRHDADDSCPVGPDGKRRHTFDYSEGGCRQVKDVEVSANLGWANPATASSMVMRRGW